MSTTETRTGLDPWKTAELPAPPLPQGLGWLSVVGPGVIVLGIAIGSGEFLLGPAVFVKYGLTLLWIAAVAIFFQTIFNTEVMRYVVATGEPVVHRLHAHAAFLDVVGVDLRGALFPANRLAGVGGHCGRCGLLSFAGRLAGPGDVDTVYPIGVGTFLLCIALLLVGRRIERTLEILNWILVTGILGSFLVLAVLVVPGRTWGAMALGFFGFDATTQRFAFLPEGVDFFLLGALAAFAGAGGVANLTLANWARDKGYGMSKHAGYIPAAVAGKRVNLTHHGFAFVPNAESMQRWRGWWRIVRADQWGVFFAGSMLGMALPALLYVTFLPPRHGDSRSRHQRRAGTRRRRATRSGHRGLDRAFSARGCCSRRNWTPSKPSRAPSPIFSGPAVVACAAGAAAMCERCTTQCWHSSCSGASSHCASRNRSCFCRSARTSPA